MKAKTGRILGFSVAFYLMSMTLGAQTVKDIDGNIYKTLRHGKQEWTASNLSVSHFRNGDTIPEARTEMDWINAAAAGKPAWCYYENDTINGRKYGKLYNWYAISDQRGLAPEGWHVTKNPDWMTLIKNLVGVDVAGPRLKSRDGWKARNGVDKIGFRALPAGVRDGKGKFSDITTKGQWWSDTAPVEPIPGNLIFSVALKSSTEAVSYIRIAKDYGLSVRCVKDK